MYYYFLNHHKTHPLIVQTVHLHNIYMFHYLWLHQEFCCMHLLSYIILFHIRLYSHHHPQHFHLHMLLKILVGKLYHHNRVLLQNKLLLRLNFPQYNSMSIHDYLAQEHQVIMYYTKPIEAELEDKKIINYLLNIVHLLIKKRHLKVHNQHYLFQEQTLLNHLKGLHFNYLYNSQKYKELIQQQLNYQE